MLPLQGWRKQGEPHPTETGVKMVNVLGRVYTVHPRNPECFFLRLLFHHIKGPKSFQDLRTVDEVVKETYKQACIELGLTEEDHHWDMTFRVISQR